MRNVLLITCLFLMVGCGSQWHLRKAIKKDPSILLTDTITVVDTVTFITETIRVDSTFIVSRDTVIIIKDKLTIKHFIHNDSVYIWGECEGDTIVQIREIHIPVDRWRVPDKRWFEYLPPIWGWLLAIGFLVYRKYFRKE